MGERIRKWRRKRRINRHPIHYGQVLELMEKRYKEKIPKHGDSWRDCPPEFFVKRILEEVEKFNNWKLDHPERLIEATDIANFASMLLAVVRGYGHACPEGHIPGRAFRSMGGP